MKLVVISTEKTMHSVCGRISKKYPGLLKKREAPARMSSREQKLAAMKEARDKKAAKKERSTISTRGNKGDEYDLNSVLDNLGENNEERKPSLMYVGKRNKRKEDNCL